MKKKTKPHYILCLFPILILIILLAYNVILFGDESLSGANQLALLVSASIATVIGLQFRTVNFKKILKDISSSIANTTPAIIILLLI